MSSLIQHPMYSDWGLACPHCGGFVALSADGQAPLPSCCSNCGRRVGNEPIPAACRLAPLRFTTMLSGEEHAIESVREQMVAVLRQFGCCEEDMLEVSLALQEALANAVIHGCRRNPGRRTSCTVECDDSTVSLTIQDPGAGFDASAVRDCTSPEGLMAGNGRGIAMMRGLMDEVSFENGGRVVRMRKTFAKAKPDTESAPAAKTRQ